MTLNDSISSPFPDILASKEVKASKAYGLKYAKAIWGNYSINVDAYNEQRDIDIINRTYAEGLESIEKFKARKNITNTSYLNLDYSPVNIIATTVDNIVGRLTNTNYKIQCNAIDSESKLKFDKYRNELYADMFLKQYSEGIEQQTGISLVSKNKVIPETEEEAELHLKMNYKDDASIAMEEAFNYISSSNKFDSSREAIIRDLVTIKRAAIQRRYDENKNIIVERIDPVDIITPYSKYQDFRNIPYIAVIKSYTVGQIAAMTDFSDAELYDIAQKYAGAKNNNPLWTFPDSYEGYYRDNVGLTIDRPYYDFNVKVLEFYFLAIDNETREFNSYKNRKFSNKVSDDYTPNKYSEVVVKKVQNLYEGCWIVASDYIFNYKRSENVPREKISGSYVPKATLPIKIIAPGIYDMKNKSLVERMIPHEDAIKLADLAFQTMLIKMKPPGVAIDVRGLVDAAKALGNNSKPMDIVKIYEQTGNFLFSSVAEEGDSVINSRVITELQGGVSKGMYDLIQVYQFQRQQINEVIGYNSAVDASSPDKEALVGVQKNAINATNNSLRPLFNAHLQLIEDTFKEIALMVQDCIEYNNEAFMNAIGTYATKTLEYGKNLAFVQMGIKIELLPDDEEKMQIEQQLMVGQQTGTLTTSDVVRIRQILKEDAKLASRLMVFLEEKNRKNRMKEQEALSQQNAQVQTQAAESAAKSQMEVQAQLLEIEKQKISMEWNLKTQYMLAESQEIQKQIMLKNSGAIQVQEVKNEGSDNVERIAHDSKILQKEHDVIINPKESNNLL